MLIMKKIVYALILMVAALSCERKENLEVRSLVNNYKLVDIETPDLSGISQYGKEVLDIYRLAALEADKIYWKQCVADMEGLEDVSDPAIKEYLQINYGPWDRFTGKAFVKGYDFKRPAGANLYPEDMTAEEFEAFDDPDKLSPYTLIRRDEDGNLKTVWYHEEYKENIDKMAAYLVAAANITIVPSVREYLLKKAQDIKTDNYYESSLAWLEMSDSKMDLIIGPNETKDDHLYGVKRSFNAYVLLKDLEKTSQLEKFVALIPKLQEDLPIEEEYKTFQPGVASTIFACNALFYAGEANAGVKDVALNLPFDPQVQKEKGTRTIILKNILEKKFNSVVSPVGQRVLDEDEHFYLSSDAFFWNVTFREVAHGLGVKETVNGRGSVDEALGSYAHLWEEMKGHVLGAYLSYNLIKEHTIDGIITPQSSIATFVASVIRSERFGTERATGKANVMIFNYLNENGAIHQRHDGKYTIDYYRAYEVISDLAGIILKTQATGDREFAESFVNRYGEVSGNFKIDSFNLGMENIPVDIRFRF